MAFHIAAFADEAGASLEEQIKAMRRNRITLLEMRNVDGVSCGQFTVAQGKAIGDRLAGEGITVWSMGSPYGKISILEDFEPHLEAFRRSLEVCDAMRIRRMRMFSFYMPEEDDPAGHRAAVLDRLDKMLAHAKDAGIDLCHENEKGIYGDTVARCRDLYTAFAGRMQGIYDPANFIQCGQDPLEAMDSLLDYVAYAHIKDARLSDGRVVPAGYGDGRIPVLLQRLKPRPAVTLTLEPHLKVFDGLQALEQGNATEQIADKTYPDSQTAFDAASNALYALLEKA